MRIYLSRWVCLDVASNLKRVPDEAAAAAAAGATLCAFPEGFLHGYRQEVDPARARDLFEAVSREHPAVAFCFGSFSEDRRNRMTLFRDGKEIARYDKVHLFAPFGEKEIWDPGDRYVAVRLGDWTLGLLLCNDVRFPEQARALRLAARADALLVVAWWPWRRDHVWQTLLRARAIENGVFVAGCCVAATENPEERFAGAGNHVFDPLGEPIRTDDDRVYDFDRARLGALVVNPLETHVRIDRVDVFPQLAIPKSASVRLGELDE
jgi:predicted amidohydrolase